ncbi:Aminodeoxychorismate synthase component 1 [Bradyrhizobium ivorense]|nr:Aminodeoxychorismate synthase component 1 [Bradyrhizobium ivorense]
MGGPPQPSRKIQRSVPPGSAAVPGRPTSFLAYDLNRTLERLPGSSIFPLRFPQSVLHFDDVVVSFDHRDRRCWIVSTGWPEQDPARRAERARRRADELAALFARPSSGTIFPAMAGAWHSNFSREGFTAAVRRIIKSILTGDIFQANIAQRFSARVSPLFDPFTFYCQLRSLNPAPFAALLRYDKLTIASSSPERFLKLVGRQVETRPIKGTIARAADPGEDRRRADALLASEKDRAESIMIVDLPRNDLSRVCTDNSVEVAALCSLESYASVHHLFLSVRGELAAGQDVVSLLRACFPGGSVTGAPKVRAMQIIVAIRTVIIDDGLAQFHAGSGITAMSNPEAEYEETLVKAQRLFDAFNADLSGAF